MPSSSAPSCAPSPSPPPTATGPRGECAGTLLDPHHRILDQPYRGKILGICTKCGNEKWYLAALDIDRPMRERVPGQGAGDAAAHKALNAAKRRLQAQKRPWKEGL